MHLTRVLSGAHDVEVERFVALSATQSLRLCNEAQTDCNLPGCVCAMKPGAMADTDHAIWKYIEDLDVVRTLSRMH
jgi:hypothetical protein